MRIGINASLGFGSHFSFENGWMIIVDQLSCDHLELTVCPSHVMEDLKHLMEIGSKPEYSDKAMAERGDYIKHFTGNDDELLALIAKVAARENEPRLTATLADIMKAGNRG